MKKLNLENHRTAKQDEPKCDTCLSFNNRRCFSVNTLIFHTYEHNTCKYHISNFLMKGCKDGLCGGSASD